MYCKIHDIMISTVQIWWSSISLRSALLEVNCISSAQTQLATSTHKWSNSCSFKLLVYLYCKFWRHYIQHVIQQSLQRLTAASEVSEKTLKF